MADGQPVLYSLYIYAPNKGAPIFFAVAFFISALFHFYSCFHHKAYKLSALHPLCATFLTAGYALRACAAQSPTNYLLSDKNTSLTLPLYIASQICIYICPPLLELNNYHVLGRVFYYAPHYSSFPYLPPGRVLTFFGGVMGLVELLNSLGVALLSDPTSEEGTISMGSDLTVAALVLQLLVIFSFYGLAGWFHWRFSRGLSGGSESWRRSGKRAGERRRGGNEDEGYVADGGSRGARSVVTMLGTLYVSMGLILVRCVYRLVEHAGGTTEVDFTDLEAMEGLSPLLRFEWYFYVFEAGLILLNSVLWNVWHPGRYLPREHNVYLSRDGMSEVIGTKDVDGRPFWAKIVNALSFGLLFRKQRQVGLPLEEPDEYQSLHDMRGSRA